MLRDWIRDRLGERPAWMNVLLVFCAYMTFVYLPWDFLVKPMVSDEEVWFGIRFYGFWAKLLELPHWAVYAAGAVGFWQMRRWMWPWAALYAAQVAIGFAVWPLVYVGGARSWVLAAVGGSAFGVLALALGRSRARFERPRPPLRERYGEWALVTGASAGIGAAFARAFAREGLSCVLTARREDRLRELAAELESRHGVKTRVLGVDLAAPGGAEQLLRGVADLEIAVLVNNAGFGGAGRFDKLAAGAAARDGRAQLRGAGRADARAAARHARARARRGDPHRLGGGLPAAAAPRALLGHQDLRQPARRGALGRVPRHRRRLPLACCRARRRPSSSRSPTSCPIRASRRSRWWPPPSTPSAASPR